MNKPTIEELEGYLQTTIGGMVNKDYLKSVAVGIHSAYSQVLEPISDEQAIEELHSELGSLHRLIRIKMNKHPEIFTDVDRARWNKANEIALKHAPPFDPKSALRASDVQPETKTP